MIEKCEFIFLLFFVHTSFQIDFMGPSDSGFYLMCCFIFVNRRGNFLCGRINSQKALFVQAFQCLLEYYYYLGIFKLNISSNYTFNLTFECSSYNLMLKCLKEKISNKFYKNTIFYSLWSPLCSLHFFILFIFFCFVQKWKFWVVSLILVLNGTKASKLPSWLAFVLPCSTRQSRLDTI